MSGFTGQRQRPCRDRSISGEADPQTTSHSFGLILLAKLVECRTEKQTTLFADSTRASRAHNSFLPARR